MKKHTVFYCLFLSVGCAYSAVNIQRIPDVVLKRSVSKITESGGVKHILNQQMIGATGAATLAEVLQSSGEMQLHDASSNGSQTLISMRGFGANAGNNTLFAINGIPITNPDIAPPDLNTLPLSDISQIEITQGSESVLYGDQAVGGVINIMTDQSKEKLLRFQCSSGSFLTRECSARLVNNYRALNYQLSMQAKSTDNYREHNHYVDETLLGTVIYQQALTDIVLDYKFTQERMQYPGALTLAQVRQDRRLASNDTDFFVDHNQYLHLNLKRKLNAEWKLLADAYASGMSGDGVLFAPFSQSRRTFYFKPTVAYDAENTLFKSGLDMRLDKYHLGSAYGVTDNQQKQGGLFALYNKPLSSKLNLVIGARGALQATRLVTDVSAYTLNKAFASNLGVTYKLRTDTNLYLRQAGSFRFPKAEENTAGNQPLRTQRGLSYEGGIQYDYEDKAVDFALYQLYLRDEISFNPLQTPQNPFGTNENLAPTVRTGASISVKSDIVKNLSGDAQINLVHARFRSGIDAGNRIPLVADFIARGGLLYHIKQYWELYTEAIFTGNEYAANDNNNVTGIQGGYMVYNFTVRFHYQNFSAALHVNNIFNQYYYLYTVYQPELNTSYFYPAADRNIMFTANYTFD